MHVNEQNQNKNKPSHVTLKLTRIMLFDLAHTQANGVIKGWLHCLTTESKGRFVINNIINVWLNMMSSHGTNPIFFNKKIKI